MSPTNNTQRTTRTTQSENRTSKFKSNNFLTHFDF